MEKINKIIKKIKSISNSTWIKIILVLGFFMMLVLNLLTPLIADDYAYSFIHGTYNRVHNLLDVVISQADHYMTWGGRSIAHSFAQIFLILPKWVFSIFNSCIYTLIIYLIYKIVKGKNKEEKPYLLFGIHFMVYFLTPVFGQDCLWLIGSCNYMWTICLILLLIYQFVLKGDRKDSLPRIIGTFLLGIISGWTNENTAFGLIVILLVTLIIDKINKIKISKWKISGFIGSILGFIIMLAAPGNYVRSSGLVDNDFIIIKWIKRFITCTKGIQNYCWLLIIALIVLITIYIYNRKKINGYVYAFILGAFFSVYSMVLSPQFPERSWFGVVLFFIIAIMILIYNLENINKAFKPLIIDMIIIFFIIFCVSYIRLARDIYRLRSTWQYRIYVMNMAKNDVDSNVEFDIFYTENMKNPNFGLIDLDENIDQWPDKDISEYYGIDSISSKIEEKNIDN